MFDSLKQFIRSRSRESWQSYAQDKFNDLRIWIQEHGEIAFFVGLLGGIIAIIFIKLLLILIALATIAGFVIWNVSEPEKK